MTLAEAKSLFYALAPKHGIDTALAAIVLPARQQPKPRLSYADVCIGAVCELYKMPPHQLLDGGRERGLADARHVCMWVLRKSGASLPAISDVMGRHHASVIHGVRRVESTPELLTVAREILARVAVRTDGRVAA